jgi:cytochrome c2
MRTRAIFYLFAFATLLARPVVSSAQEDDVKAGKELFRWECYKTCHFMNNPYAAQSEGWQNWFIRVKAAILGPDLRGVYNSPAGRRTQEGFRHSGPFLDAAPKIVWTEEMLDKWLEDSQKVIPGAWMSVKFPDPNIRRKIIAFLKTYK